MGAKAELVYKIPYRLVCKIPLLARAPGPKAARPSASSTICYLVYNISSCAALGIPLGRVRRASKGILHTKAEPPKFIKVGPFEFDPEKSPLRGAMQKPELPFCYTLTIK